MRTITYKIPIYLFSIIPLWNLTNIKLLLPLFNQQIYYSILFVIITYLLINFKIRKVNIFGVALLMSTALSLILNSVPEYFESTLRWFGWVLLFATLGPFISNSGIRNFREKSLNWVLLICEIVGVFSFFWFALGLPNIGRGHFTGLTYHSMLLGPISSIGFLSIFNKIIYRKLSILFLLPLFFCLITIILSGSRTAIIACFFASLIPIYYQFNLKAFIIIIILSLFTLPLSNSFFNTLNNKGIDNSRLIHWTDRIEEFNSNPIFGIGFSSVSSGSMGDSGDGGIEPGSSWLAILSMTGMIGFLSFILMIISILIEYKRKSFNFYKKESSIYLSVIVFFLVSFVSEGYVFACGSSLAMIFWLVLGRVYDLNKY